MKVHSDNFVQEDEIDLKELFLVLWKKRIFICIFTSFVTLMAVVYVYFKPYTPIYEGTLNIEIGEVFDKNNSSKLIDFSYNLSKIIEKEFDKYNIIVEIPKKTDPIINNLIELKVLNNDRTLIAEHIEEVFRFIVNRHNSKTKLYEKFTETKKIGEISISNQPINLPKKKLIVIVSFVSGLILSFFLVFLLNFITSFRDNLQIT